MCAVVATACGGPVGGTGTATGPTAFEPAAALDAEPVWTAWSHLGLGDLALDLERLQPVRARYLQVMYDLEGRQRVQSRTLLHLTVDRAVHSGRWDGTLPARIEPVRSPGLLIEWEVQNALYNAFDRVLTDERLSDWIRVMPAGSDVLLVSRVEAGERTVLDTSDRPESDSVAVWRSRQPDGAVNVLTVPYLLAALDLQPGARFTLPGYALTRGAQAEGGRWQGALRVRSVGPRSVRGRTVEVAEVWLDRVDPASGATLETLDPLAPGRRRTRLLISREPPYLLGRMDVGVDSTGAEVPVREFLGLVEWAPLPLPGSDLIDPGLWDLDLTTGSMSLRPDQVPELVLDPR